MLRKLIKRIGLPTPKIGKIITGIGAVLGIGGGTAVIVNEITLTNDFVIDIVVIIAITVITIVSGSAQIPPELKDKLNDE